MVNVSNYGYNKNFLTDAMNHTGARTQSNTRSESYNCGGFALGTFSWYYPYDSDILSYALAHGFITKEQEEDIINSVSKEFYEEEVNDFLYDYNGSKKSCEVIPTYSCWRSMAIQDLLEEYTNSMFYKNSGYIEYFIDKILTEVPNIRVINELADLKPNEYCVAFRVGGGDFHFIRSNDSSCSTWIGKLGWNRVKELDYYTFSGTEEEKFDDLFGDRYDSDTIFFAKVA